MAASITHNTATGVFSLFYNPVEVGGTPDDPIVRNDVLVPEGEWTAFCSPFRVDGGATGLILLSEGRPLEFLTHDYMTEPVEGIVSFQFPGRQITLRVEHFEDDTLVFSYSSDRLSTWNEMARFIPESPVVEVGVVLRYQEGVTATSHVGQFRLFPGIWQNTAEEVWIGEPGAFAQSRDVGLELQVASTAEPYVHALVGGQFGDLEFDVGKSVRWLTWYVDNLFVLDVNLGTPRYWIVNWTETFPDAEHTVTGINYFVVPEKFRKEQWEQYKLRFGEPMDDEWFLFIDAHEGWSVDNRTLPNDYAFAPFRSFLWREIQRAIDLGNPYAILPLYVFLRSDNITNVSYASAMDDVVNPDNPDETIPPILQALSVPYYLPYKGMKRLWSAAELKKTDFDWSQIDTPVDWDVKAGTGTPAVPAYLTPSVGTVSTPDPVTMPNQCVFVYKVQQSNTPVAASTLAAQYEPSTQLSWLTQRANSTGQMRLSLSSTGASGGVVTKLPTTLVPVTGADEYIAMSYDLGNDPMKIRLFTSTNGTAWTQSGTEYSVARTVPFNGTGVVRIGAYLNVAPQEVFQGRIYSVELRTGVDPAAGTVLWKFDANDYPGTGTLYVDPRGKTWTLSAAGAITPKVVAVPAVPAAKAQIISYGYAHWNLQDIEPPATEVPPLTEANDDGWRMRNMLSAVRPIPGLPLGAWVPPASDPAGLPGPWAPADANNPDPVHPDTRLPMPPPVPPDPTLEGIVTPLYDCVFRINMRDGVWYESGLSGNIPLIWDEATGKWTTNYDPALWADQGVESYDPTAVP